MLSMHGWGLEPATYVPGVGGGVVGLGYFSTFFL